jgi:hypothetical protein
MLLLSEKAASFVSIVLYLIHKRINEINGRNIYMFKWNCSQSRYTFVTVKTNGMTFNPTTTLKLIYWFIYHQSIVHFPKMSSIIYPYVPINPIYFVNCYMISLSITDKNFVNHIDEGIRFPHQICVSHHRVHPISYMCTTVTHYCFFVNCYCKI